jgi:hypothetical protein
VDVYASSGDTIHAYAGWHYTLGWGNFFTVMVASIAIVASVTVNVIMLRRNASHFEQGRIDSRNDKLRAEVIDLISALSQRSSQVAIVLQRINQLERVDRQAIHQNIEDMFSGDLWDSYRRANSHAFAVLALTEDKQAAEAIGLILAASEKYEKWLRPPPPTRQRFRWSTALRLTRWAMQSMPPPNNSSCTPYADSVLPPTTNTRAR